MNELTEFQPWQPDLGPITVYLLLVGGLMLALLLLTRWLGERRESAEKAMPYECGIIPTGSAGLPYPAPFYLIAVFFLVFDVEGAFIFSWAVAFKELGWWGWFEMTFFIAVLGASLVYLWAKKGLDWRDKGAKGAYGPH